MRTSDRLSPTLLGHVASYDGSLTYRLDGELDLAATGALRERIDQLASGAQERRVVFDLAELRFVDSAGMRALCQIHAALEGAGQQLVLVNPQRIVNRLLDLLGLRGYLNVED